MSADPPRAGTSDVELGDGMSTGTANRAVYGTQTGPEYYYMLISKPPRPATFGTAVRLAEVDAAHQPSRIDDDDLQHQNGTPTTRSHAASGRTPFVSMWTVALSSLKQCAETYYEIRHTPTPPYGVNALLFRTIGLARGFWFSLSSTVLEGRAPCSRVGAMLRCSRP